ncbi:MAG: alpha/beta hydrolase, partial [Bacteroidaceae bacterium]|nr:alpha/beta hydrolase [Bacteroidaceae bacterium]
EYSPYDFTSRRFGSIRGTGDVTLQWLIHEVKPHIDRHYRTWWHREATAVAGSSMGGLMALYALLRYNDYFSKAAAISPSVGFNMPAMEAEIERNEYHADTRLFVSYGTREQSPRYQSLYTKNVTAVARTLADKGFCTQLHRHERGTHCEACWEEEVPLWMPFLWL